MPPKDNKKTTKIIKKPAVHKTAVVKVEKEVQLVEPGAKEKAEKQTKSFVRAVGRRKRAVARVRLYPQGSGQIKVNGKDYKNYFSYFQLSETVIAPLVLLGKTDNFDFTIKVVGGGSTGQAGACRHGLARALVKFNEEYKMPLRKAGFLTRDSREKERKKFGLKRARRAPQWQKR